MSRASPTDEEIAAVERLIAIAFKDTGQCRHVANFLLAWANAMSFGGWDPVDMWCVDQEIIEDELLILRMVAKSQVYPNNLGMKHVFRALARKWRPNLFKDDDDSDLDHFSPIVTGHDG
jgi:chorismate mutase